MSKHKSFSQANNECLLYVQGMHCSSCELLIEKKLIKKDNISAVDVSRQNDSVRIFFSQPSSVDVQALNSEFADLGYTFSYQQPLKKNMRLLYRNEQGNWQWNKIKLKKLGKTFIWSFILLGIFFFVERLRLGRLVSVTATSSLVAFWLLGLVAGVSSCAALVGGLLMSMTKQWHEIYIDDDKQKVMPHMLFHIGRLVSFFGFGGLLGLLGNSISFNNTIIYAGLVLLISLVMIILALQMLEVSWAKKISIRLPKFIARTAVDEQKFKGKYMPFVTGVMTFFLPCGFTLIAQGIALTTGNFLTSGLIMLFFALGTLPMLLGISFTGIRFTKKPNLTAKFSQVAGIIIIFFAIYNINGQLNALGFKSLSDIGSLTTKSQVKEVVLTDDPLILFGPDAGKRLSETTNTVVKENKISNNTDGEQLLSLMAKGFEYIPTGPTTLQANVPTKLVVQNEGIQGCGTFITGRGLFDGFVDLQPGENVIDIGSPKPGSYKITCSMGMVPPVTVKFK
jgi:sulfite exporter TauE/SafE/copper chaperone CopZ